MVGWEGWDVMGRGGLNAGRVKDGLGGMVVLVSGLLLNGEIVFVRYEGSLEVGPL